jgi:hypothetical protein
LGKRDEDDHEGEGATDPQLPGGVRKFVDHAQKAGYAFRPLAETSGGEERSQEDEEKKDLDTETVADDSNQKTEEQESGEIAQERGNEHELAVGGGIHPAFLQDRDDNA